MSKYRTICADPPWPYESPGDHLRSTRESRPHSWDSPLNTASSDKRYGSLSLASLLALPVRELAEPAAHLYLWTTNAFMAEAHALAKAWGFAPKTILTWGKVHQDDRSKPSMKTGYYFRGATEHVVFAVRGSLPIQGTWPTLFLWPRIGEHSVKPEAFYDLVEQASPGPYVELFSRRHRMFWDVWGNESANTAILEPLA